MIENSIYHAAHNGDVAKVEAWLNAHRDQLNAEISDGFNLLHIASAFGQEQLVAHLLDRGALVNANATNQARETSLHLATMFRDHEVAARIVDRLIANGAELNAKQVGGQTPLHHAVGRESKAVTETLIMAGADPFLKDDQGKSAMDLAQGNDDLKAILKKAHHLPTEV
jgi:uncharacterized protein